MISADFIKMYSINLINFKKLYMSRIVRDNTDKPCPIQQPTIANLGAILSKTYILFDSVTYYILSL